MLPQTLRRGLRLAGTLAAMTGAGACSDITSTAGTDAVQIDDLHNAEGALALRAGAISLFADMYGSHITVSGAIADEVFGADPGNQADRREFADPPFGSPYAYTMVQRARVNLVAAASALERFAPDPEHRIGELYALAGYTILFLGEAMCSGIPLSHVEEDGQLVFGEPHTRTELFDAAATHFETALAYTEDDPEIGNLARVGRARALLNNARFADAAAAVAGVPADFAYRTHHSASIQPNDVHRAFYISQDVTVGDREGRNGLDFVSAGDPRLPTVVVGVSPWDDETTIHAPTKYPSLDAPILLASGIEARLVEAEARLKGDDAAGALNILNELRTAVPGLDPLSLEASEGGQVDQLFRERAFWLFLTGTRQGDLRRLIREYGRKSEKVFPTGAYKGAASYGSDVSFPPGEAEYSNPHYHGCLNRDA